MGTRADFYIGRGEQAEWLGSIAWDGNPYGRPSCFEGDMPVTQNPVLIAKSDNEFRDRVKNLLDRRDDATKPDQGWPWPWVDSRTTDYSYAIYDGKVWASCFGRKWFDPLLPEPDDESWGPKELVFPNMEARKKVTLGKRSGLLIVTLPKGTA